MQKRFALGLIALAACGKPAQPASNGSVATTAPTASAAPPLSTPQAKLLVLVDGDAPSQGAFTPNGDVVAVSDGRLWRWHPGAENAMTTPIPAARPRLVVAKNADIAIVIGQEGTAYPFKDGKAMTPFPLDTPFGVYAISDDGRIFAARERGGGTEGTRLYDVATGKPLSKVDRSVLLSPDGQFVVTGSGIATTTGAMVVPFGDEGNIRTAAWVGEKVMTWETDALRIADPVTKKQDVFATKCPRGSDTRDYVDAANRQAYRFCAGKLTIVTLDGTRRDLRIGGQIHKSQVPEIMPSQDGSRLILGWWQSGKKRGIETLDPQTGATKPLEKLPALRAEDEAIQLLGFMPEPGINRERTRAVSNGTVVDLATGRELTRWSAPKNPRPQTPLVAFLDGEGLEIAADLDPERPTGLHIGADATTKLELPLLRPDGHCPQSAYEPHRTIDGLEALYTWPYGGACVCTSKKCAVPNLPDYVFSHRGKRALADINGLQLVEDEKKTAMPVKGNAFAGTFIDDQHIVVLTHQDGLPMMLHELTLDPPALTSSRAIASSNAFGSSMQVIATSKSVVVVEGDEELLVATVYPRGTTSTIPSATVHAWPGQAIVQLSDGGVEMFGESATSVLACSLADGTVKPYTACRDTFESKGRFRVE